MDIYERLRERLEIPADDETVTEIIIGRIYIGVQLESGALGLAHREGHRHHDPDTSSLEDEYEGMSVVELLSLMGDRSPVRSALGIATASALARRLLTDWEEGDILKHIEIRVGDRVVMVGDFPLGGDIKERGGELKVFDRSKGMGSVGEMHESLRNADIAIITATALINGTLPKILDSTISAREVIILGPSTPLLPEAFSDTPVTRLFGIIPEDVKSILEVIRGGGGTRMFTPNVKKVGVRVK